MRTGHFRSSFLGKAVDAKGEPIPWYTYPAIELLKRADFTHRRVLEVGAGHSTMWWSRRAKSVIAFDSNPHWYHFLKERNLPNVQLNLVASAAPAVDGGPYDVVVIDGLHRESWFPAVLDLVAHDGAVIFDDSESYLPMAPEIVPLSRERGFQRVDLYGFAPGVIGQHCTSIFFNRECFLFANETLPAY